MTGQPDDVAAALQGPNVWLLAALLAAVLLVLGAHTGRSTGWGRPFTEPDGVEWRRQPRAAVQGVAAGG